MTVAECLAAHEAAKPDPEPPLVAAARELLTEAAWAGRGDTPAARRVRAAIEQWEEGNG